MANKTIWQRLKYILCAIAVYVLGCLIMIPCGIAWVFTGKNYFDRFTAWAMELDENFENGNM